MTLLMPGQTIRDTYLVERLLGEGAFAEVYRVKHRFLGRQAMKVFKAYGATIAEIERDIAECVLLSGLKHPNIVEVFDANVLETEKGPVGYFTMKHMAGGTLDQYRRKFTLASMPVDECVDIVAQVTRALAIAHAAAPPIVHRDVKPQNILIGYENGTRSIKLSDFGLAKAANPLTLMLSSKGTRDFKPPESHFNIDSCASDVWAVGATLYQLLTGALPTVAVQSGEVPADDPQRLIYRPPSTYNVCVDAALDSILALCLAHNPKHRYADAMHLEKALDAWRGRTPARAVEAIARDDHVQLTTTPAGPRFDARAELERAFMIADDPTRLDDAAAILERCMDADAEIREHHLPTLAQWKKGIVHVALRR